MKMKPVYIDNTCSDTRMFHNAIMEAIKNGGVFNDDLSDIFKLVKTPEGSAAEYRLEFA